MVTPKSSMGAPDEVPGDVQHAVDVPGDVGLVDLGIDSESSKEGVAVGTQGDEDTHKEEQGRGHPLQDNPPSFAAAAAKLSSVFPQPSGESMLLRSSAASAP